MISYPLPFMFIVPFFRSAGRSLLRAAACLAATSAALFAQTPSAADGFDPDVDGNVYVAVAQPDGRLLIGGQFGTVRGFPRNNLARLNVDGSLDETFNPNANGPVRALALQADNRIVIGGDFTTLQPGATGAAVTRNRVARLNTDGSVDTAFTAGIGAALPPQLALTPQVFALAVQADGAIVVGGSFGSAQSGTAAAAARKNLARFTATGALDATFDPTANGAVLSLAVHVDRKIVVGGGFTSLWPAGDVLPSDRNRIARLNPNGTVDSQFNPNANNAVSALAIQRDGKILLGGVFTTLQPPTDSAPANRVHVARLNVTGTLDSEFYPRVEGNVTALALQGDGSLVVGGTFNSAWGRGSTEGNRNNLARFLPDGALDANFAPAVNAAVDTLAALPDGRVVVGGHFTRVLAVGATTGLVRNHLARLNAEGSFDTGFELDAGGRILASVTQSDGKLVVAGTFTNVGGTTHNYVARLNADGTVDNAYAPDFNGRVYALAYDSAANKVIAGGEFTKVGTDTRNHLVRLNGSGTLAGTVDSEFYPSLDGQVGSLAIQSDGKILVGGAFTGVQAVGASAPVQRPNLLRLNANGSLDTAFDPEPNSSVSSILVQSDGKIVIGGLFTTVQPGGAPTLTTTNGVTTTTFSTATITPRNNLARLNADGALDTTFDPRPNGQVSAIVQQIDGKLIIAGAFAALNPAGAPSLTTTNADGTKTTTTVSARARLARLNPNGTVDPGYDPNSNGNILALALQGDKLLLGGTFTTLQPLQPTAATTFTLRKYAARLNADGTVDNTFNLDLNELPGNRVDSIRVQPDGRILLGGSFNSLQPTGAAARVTRRNFARLLPGANAAANVTVDSAFDVNAAGSTGAIVNALVVQADGKVLVGGSFSDLGGAKTTNLARFRAEGIPDASFSPSLSTDGPVNAIALRPNIAATPTQVAGFAWLNPDGTLRAAFSSAVRLSGTISAVAVDNKGRLLLGGSFTNLAEAAGVGGGLLRFTADGKIDSTFTYPSPNGQITGLVVQNDGRIVVVGSFTVIGGATRNNIARLNEENGSVDVTYDPNANARITSIVKEADGRIVVGGAFTSFTPNAATDVVTRNYLARVNENGTLDTNYNPNANAPVNALA
ncbi:MAG: delta-60 repeat domain-containing protein, partial [Opitutaceae bacterium]